MRPVNRALPIALRAKDEHKVGLLMPKDNAGEAAGDEPHARRQNAGGIALFISTENRGFAEESEDWSG